MEAKPVDPRDQSWEPVATAYRVYFWSADGGACNEFELTGATDVREVLEWATLHANGRVPEVFVRVDSGGELGLVRILGGRPNA